MQNGNGMLAALGLPGEITRPYAIDGDFQGSLKTGNIAWTMQARGKGSLAVALGRDSLRGRLDLNASLKGDAQRLHASAAYRMPAADSATGRIPRPGRGVQRQCGTGLHFRGEFSRPRPGQYQRRQYRRRRGQWSGGIGHQSENALALAWRRAGCERADFPSPGCKAMACAGRTSAAS